MSRYAIGRPGDDEEDNPKAPPRKHHWEEKEVVAVDRGVPFINVDRMVEGDLYVLQGVTGKVKGILIVRKVTRLDTPIIEVFDWDKACSHCGKLLVNHPNEPGGNITKYGRDCAFPKLEGKRP